MVFVLEDIYTIRHNRKIDASRTRTLETLLPNSAEVLECSKLLNKPMNAGECFDLYGYTQQIMGEFNEGASSYNWGGIVPEFEWVYMEALANAIVRGNKSKEESKLVTILMYGLEGGIISIEDEGEGFDYRDEILRFQRGDKRTINGQGQGLKRFDSTPLSVSYHGDGNLIMIATPLKED